MTKELTLLQANCKSLAEGFMYRGVQWEDATSYSRDSKVRIPTSFSANLNALRITVTCGHIHYRPEWVFICHELGFSIKILGTYDDPKEAIDSALGFCHARLSSLFHALEPTR